MVRAECEVCEMRDEREHSPILGVDGVGHLEVRDVAKHGMGEGDGKVNFEGEILEPQIF